MLVAALSGATGLPAFYSSVFITPVWCPCCPVMRNMQCVDGARTIIMVGHFEGYFWPKMTNIGTLEAISTVKNLPLACIV